MTLTTLLSWCTFFFSFSYSYTKIVKNSPPHNPRDCWQGLRLGVWSERMGLRCPIPGEGLDSLSKYWIMKKSWSRVWSRRKRGSKPFYKAHKVRWSLPLPAQKTNKNKYYTHKTYNKPTNKYMHPTQPFQKDYKALCSLLIPAQKTKQTKNTRETFLRKLQSLV